MKVLSRRIPVPAPLPSTGMPGAPPASAVPHYLQKGIAPNQPRPRSPSLQQRSGTTPAEPIKRATTPGTLPCPQSPGANAPPLPPLPRSASRADIDVDIVLLDGPPEASVRLGESFILKYRIAVSGALPGGQHDLLGQQTAKKARFVSLAVQHVVADRLVPDTKMQSAGPTLKRHSSRVLSMDAAPSSPGIHSPSSNTGSIDMLTPRRVVSPPPGGPAAIVSGPAAAGADINVAAPTAVPSRGIAIGGLEERLRRIALSEALGTVEDDGRTAFGEDDEELAASFNVRLPPPFKSINITADEKGAHEKGSGLVRFLGSSALFLPPIELRNILEADERVPEPGMVDRGEGCAEFTLTYYPKSRGFATVGGLRVLLVKDEERLVSSEDDRDSVTLHQGNVQQSEATTVREWDVIAEIWIR